jgi:LysM repeat protein
MKHFLPLFALVVLLCGAIAEDAPVPAAAPETKAAPSSELKEIYERLNSDIEVLAAANVSLQKRVAALAEELKAVRDEQSRAGSAAGSSQEDLRRLAEKIQEVDRKREADRELILGEIEKIRKSIAALAAAAPDHAPAPPIIPSGSKEKSIPYTVRKGDTLSAILNDYNTELKSKGMKTVTIKQVEEANPGINIRKLKAGQSLLLPLSQ